MSQEDTSALAPLKNRAFAWLWLGVLVSSIGAWAQTVGAQWLFVNDPNGATIVSLVQTATMLPMMLLALPGGVLADAFDRRGLLLGIQCDFVVVALSLAVLAALGQVPPVLLLAFTFAIGMGTALQLPTWQPLITELVPRAQIPAATRLDMVNVNVSRAAGPNRTRPPGSCRRSISRATRAGSVSLMTSSATPASSSACATALPAPPAPTSSARAP